MRRVLHTIVLTAFLSGAYSFDVQSAEIPPAPSNNAFVSDYANLIKPDVHQQIIDAQKEAFEKYNTPIIIVTIPSMANYGAEGVDIKDFARQWFNKWRIGTLDAKEAGANKGILLMVSVGDRKARIELGADWAHNWDDATQSIMDNDIVPQFKQGNFSGGISQGVKKLAEMAAKGPSSAPPPPDLIKQIDSKLSQNQNVGLLRSFNPYPTWVSILLMLGGVALISAGIFMPDHRKALIIAGAAMLIGGFSILLLLFFGSAFARGQGGAGGGSGFSGYSGGGFSGGFSGGGGASGSW